MSTLPESTDPSVTSTDPRTLPLSRRAFLFVGLAAGCVSRGARDAAGGACPARGASHWIGYTEYRTNLATRYDNQITSRACLVERDGSGRRALAEGLTREPCSWTQFAGWSVDGCSAFIGRGWESRENAAWEEEHKTFRMTEGWRHDMYVLDLASGDLANVTAVERVSDYNSGLFSIPGGTGRLGFTALIGGISHPFVMDADGKNKRDLSQGPEGFSYGFSASPDGRFVAYHKDYQVFVAEADGSNPRRIETGNPFNFVPQWSPDGALLLFVSGEHYNCHPYVVRPDGTALRKLADRGGYEGVVPVYDVFDFHGGSSDVPVWADDGASVYYTARIGEAVELMRVSLDGGVAQHTRSAPGTLHYHPKPAPGGGWLAFGSNRTGTRQLYVMPENGGEPHAITDVSPGHGAMWGYWRPMA